MGYSAEISSRSPGLLVFSVDQSSLMERPSPTDKTKSLAQTTADVINEILYKIVLHETVNGRVTHSFDLAVLGYGSNVSSAIQSRPLDLQPGPINEIANMRVDKRLMNLGNGSVEIPIWLVPVANGKVHLCEALNKCYEIVNNWINSHPSSFPPVVVNITTGESSDGDPRPIAEKIRKLSTYDGNTLLFNIHVFPSGTNTVAFAAIEESLPDEEDKKTF